jgi:aryl-alcohol dehydrogenase-like predicted oxidoreductase
MEYRVLGQTGMRVSTLALGCWAFAGDANWGAQDDAASIATVHAALDAGVNLFDTAEAYGDGHSEEVVGRALVGKRAQALIATKASADHLAPAALVAACERSLRRLQTDTIDLYQIHWPSRSVPLAETMAALRTLVQQGKVRAVGVCNFGLLDMDDLAAAGGAVSNQLPYSLVWRAIEDAIQPRCRAMGMGVLCYQPLMQGLLTGKFASAAEVPAGRARTRHFGSAHTGTRHGEAGCEEETFSAIAGVREIAAQLGQPMANVSLAWVLQQPGVSTALVGARTPEQVQQNVAATALTLAPETLAALAAATATLKRALGPNPDPYQGGASGRFR